MGTEKAKNRKAIEFKETKKGEQVGIIER